MSMRLLLVGLALHLSAGTSVAAQALPTAEGCAAYAGSCRTGSNRATASFGTGAYVDQVGADNRAGITQRQGSTNSFARIFQSGEQNTAFIGQDATSSFADVTQSGDDNTASVTQSGTAHNSASISQSGGGNTASVNQMSALIGHTANLQQKGNGNRIDLNQSGNGNSAILEQDGEGNAMNASQTGYDNVLTWVQNGSGLSGPIVTMEGNGRAISIYQSNPSGQR
ncbi:hypothetical protein [Brevundimonas variabilis]|uniref:Curlin-associated protein n=1 Tax=Brevundimonas variabilis TaxID=74312 RepID=A0A7W9FEA6_9CAUL|nr:hypothetical protein [Brevundimonas variabilis]MBB5746291.1 hypothetical protein [Brevundimonas variabilis]